MSGALDILNVGIGDLKLRWNPGDESDVAKAQDTVEMLLKQGYAICIERPDGTYARVKRFSREDDCYIISEVASGEKGKQGTPGGAEGSGAAEERLGSGKGRRGRPPKGESRVPRSSARGTAIGPSAGG